MIDRLLQSLPSFKGKQRLARFLFKKEIRRGKEFNVIGKWNCIYKLPNISENVGFEIMLNGVYESTTINFIIKQINHNGLFLDIGANIGAITIPVSQLRQDIKLISIEAAPWIFDYLTYNVTANQLLNVELINKAVTDKAGNQVDFFSPKDKFGKGSLAPVFTEASVRIETITLDVLKADHHRPIAFIKVDVEGFEAAVFRGGADLLSASEAPDILFEFIDWAEDLAGEITGAAQLVLINYGYRIYLMERGKIGQQLRAPIKKGGALIFATKKKGKV